MTITYVKWKDAQTHEAADGAPAVAELAVLEEVGFLLAENDEALLIGMEIASVTVQAGRWRLHIPKTNIIERQDINLPSPPKKRVRKSKTAVIPTPDVSSTPPAKSAAWSMK